MTTADISTRPRLRIVHQMARSGGTVISRCLACMNHVMLLSEIHAAGSPHRSMNPLYQAQGFFGLFTPEDRALLSGQGGLSFGMAIALIEERARARRRALVIREWSHADYTGLPGWPEPSYGSPTVAVLSRGFDILRFSTVRHPLDQWLSLASAYDKEEPVPLDTYLHGVRRFAETAQETGFIRYEDFCADPVRVMETLCQALDLAVDPGFLVKQATWRAITGDSPGIGRGRARIEPLPPRSYPPSLLERLGDNDDYRRSLALLGYRHPGSVAGQPAACA